MFPFTVPMMHLSRIPIVTRSYYQKSEESKTIEKEDSLRQMINDYKSITNDPVVLELVRKIPVSLLNECDEEIRKLRSNPDFYYNGSLDAKIGLYRIFLSKNNVWVSNKEIEIRLKVLKDYSM